MIMTVTSAYLSWVIKATCFRMFIHEHIVNSVIQITILNLYLVQKHVTNELLNVGIIILCGEIRSIR